MKPEKKVHIWLLLRVTNQQFLQKKLKPSTFVSRISSHPNQLWLFIHKINFFKIKANPVIKTFPKILYKSSLIFATILILCQFNPLPTQISMEFHRKHFFSIRTEVLNIRSLSAPSTGEASLFKPVCSPNYLDYPAETSSTPRRSIRLQLNFFGDSLSNKSSSLSLFVTPYHYFLRNNWNYLILKTISSIN